MKKNTKFQLNSSKIMPASPKKHRDMGCEYHYSFSTSTVQKKQAVKQAVTNPQSKIFLKPTCLLRRTTFQPRPGMI